MFSIQCVRIRNFRSYAGCHEFDFPTQNGLYFLTGKNLLDPGVGANAVGKSSLLDAVFWCLYGKTTRGLRSSDVATRGVEEKYFGVSIDVTVGDQTSDISRTYNPNRLEMAGKIVDQSAIDKFLRLSPEAFLYSVILPQFGTSFFDLTPAAKLAVFSSIMDLDYWQARSEAAAERAKRIDGERYRQEQALARAEGQTDSILIDLENLQVKEAAFSKTQGGVVLSIEESIAAALKDVKFIESNMRDCGLVIANAEKQILKLSAKCPTCGQSIPNADLKEFTQNKSDFERKLQRLSQDQTRLAQSLDTHRKSLAIERKRENPYSEIIAEKKRALTKLDEQVETSKAKLGQLGQEHTAVSFWVGGFKRIRLFVIEEALSQLEIEINNTLISLGLNGWRVALDVERENKSGGITKGFTVLTYPPNAEEPVRYESYSGGETQRLRLAGDLGLANLIMERNGLANTIEFYDEFSAHLSSEGIRDVLDTLYERAHSNGKCIWVVDHHVLEYPGFSGVLGIIKTSKGSRFEYQGTSS